jgi:hypothetical protein
VCEEVAVEVTVVVGVDSVVVLNCPAGSLRDAALMVKVVRGSKSDVGPVAAAQATEPALGVHRICSTAESVPSKGNTREKAPAANVAGHRVMSAYISLPRDNARDSLTTSGLALI